MSRTLPFAAILVSQCASLAFADDNPVQWEVNGHWYLAIVLPKEERVDWEQARELARQYRYRGMRGHLVTLTSKEENSFVFELAKKAPANVQQFWLGGRQPASKDGETKAEAMEGWHWVTGEKWPGDWKDAKRANWRDEPDYEPNNDFGGGDYGTPAADHEDALHFAGRP